MRAIRDAAMGSTRGKLGGWLIAPAVRELRQQIDPETPGGAYMLGLRQLGVVAHGRFTRRGFARAIEVAAQGVEQDVVGATRAALERAGALRTPQHAGVATADACACPSRRLRCSADDSRASLRGDLRASGR